MSDANQSPANPAVAGG